ncbi:MAG TPA: ornithine carbamoyltransferase [Acidimicrobiales bacterium]
MTRHLLDLDDLSPAELSIVLDLSQKPEPPRALQGLGAALLFEKPSARTRHSTEMAVVQLGGHPITMRGDEVGLDVRESVEDVTRTLCCYHAAICARVFEHSKVERMAAVSTVPVVNMLSDRSHPLQGLADLLTLQQRFGSLQGLRLAWVGDFSNVARSLSIGAAMSGASLVWAGPEGYGPSDADVARVLALGGELDEATTATDAVIGADCVVTDAWYSMGQEGERDQRRAAFRPYRVDGALMAQAKPTAVFLHCLPAHRGEEVTDDVVDGQQSLVWAEAENRMHTARGALLFLLGERP